jgi:hypothetical protein
MRGDLADYVLHPASSREREVITGLMPRIEDAVGVWMREGVLAAMNKHNGKEHPPT